MTEPWNPESHPEARNVLTGLVPTHDYSAKVPFNGRDSAAFSHSMLSTVPILLAGSMAVSMTLTGAVAPVSARPATDPNSSNGNSFGEAASSRIAAAGSRHTQLTHSVTEARALEPAPGVYTVVAGDTVSDIASRFGLSTASVLALNGLGWKTTIFPGQTLRLTSVVASTPRVPVAAPAPVSIAQYIVVRGDTLTHIAERFGVSVASILEANQLSRTSLIFPGQSIAIPVKAGANPAPVPPTEAIARDGERQEPVVTDEVVSSADAIVDSTAVLPEATPVDASGSSPVSGGANSAPQLPPAQAPAPAPAPGAGSYVIKPGDTLSKIAASFGISVASLCSANGLSTSSMIFAGKTLVIPSGTAPAASSDNVTLLTAEGETNARTIIAVGRELGVSDYGIIIALATAMQESSMRNLNYGHLDSVGLFQQRPTSGWGTVAQLTTPSHAARLFYGGPSNPNKGKTRGLLDIAGWQSMSVTQAAQKVQISAYPDAYAKWEASARYWLANL